MSRGHTPIPVMPEWRARGACVGHPTDWWFPDVAHPRGDARAKAICRTCPVVAECLGWALDRGEPGIWGGTSERERQRIRRGR